MILSLIIRGTLELKKAVAVLDIRLEATVERAVSPEFVAAPERNRSP
jgi:hypothetical protein